MRSEYDSLEKAWAEHPEYADFRFSERMAEDGSNPRLHVIMHSVVERQLGSGDAPEVAKALDRLLAAGLDRHDAIHEIGKVVAEMLWAALDAKNPMDAESYRRALDELGR